MKIEIGSILRWQGTHNLWRVENMNQISADGNTRKVRHIGTIGSTPTDVRINKNSKTYDFPPDHGIFTDAESVLHICPRHSVIFDLT